MLKIKVGTEYLDMGKFSVSFELLSPVFNDVGSFSYPFTLPATAKNKQVLGFPAKVNYANFTTQKVAVELFLSGLFWKRGNLVITEANKDSIRANFTVSEGYFYSTIKDLKLADLDLGGERWHFDYETAPFSPFNAIFDKSYPEVDFILFPVFWPEFYGDTAKGTLLNDTFFGYVNWFNHEFPFYGEEANTLVLFPFLNYVMKQAFARLNINPTKNIFTQDQYLRQLVLFNHISCNVWTVEEEGVTPVTNTEHRFSLNNYVPDLTVSELFDFLNKIFKSIVFYNDFSGDISIILLRDILQSNDIIGLDAPFKMNYLKLNEYDGFTMSYVIDSSDKSAEQYFKDISKFNFKGELSTLAELPDSNNLLFDLYFIRDIHKYYYYNVTYSIGGDVGEFVEYSDDLLTITEGNGDFEFEIPGVFAKSARRQICANDGAFQEYEVPLVFPDKPEPRLMFWHGLQPNFGTPDKPFGSAFNVLPLQQTIISPYSLEWEGEYGIKENFHKKFLEFKKTTRETEISMILKASELKNIDFSRKYRFAEANWLLSSIKFTVTNDRISPATIIAYKV